MQSSITVLREQLNIFHFNLLYEMEYISPYLTWSMSSHLMLRILKTY